MRDVHVRFIRRLAKLGIRIELKGNFPWVYLGSVNDILVTERYQSEHGFTAFYYFGHKDPRNKFSYRKKVFEKVRSMLNE